MHHVFKVSLLLLFLGACTSQTPATQPVASPSAGSDNGSATASPAVAVDFTVAHAIIQQRCVTCHSATPTRPGFSSPAGGVTFDTPAQIKAKASRIFSRAVQSASMPQGNVTQMTDAEREQLRAWIEAGAPIN